MSEARRSSRNAETLLAALDAFNRRDGERFDALLAEDVEIVPARAALDGTVYRGPDAGTQYCAAVDTIWDGLTFESEDVTDGGDWVLALGRMRGRALSSDTELDVTGGWVARFRDGLITSFHAYADRAKALEAVGIQW